MSFNDHLKKKISVVNSDRTNHVYLNPLSDSRMSDISYFLIYLPPHDSLFYTCTKDGVPATDNTRTRSCRRFTLSRELNLKVLTKPHICIYIHTDLNKHVSTLTKLPSLTKPHVTFCRTNTTSHILIQSMSED
jgi:hypothetical protein